MKKNQTESPSTFEDAFAGLGFSSPETGEQIANLDDNIVDTVDVKTIEDQDPEVKTTEETTEEDTLGVKDDTSDIPEDLLDDKKSKDDINNKVDDNEEETLDDDTEEDVDPTEAKGVGAFFDAFADSLGWDVEEENKPDSIEGLVDYIKDLVEENSKPEYANYQIKQLDEYVKNGGNFTDFYNNMSHVASYDNLDIEDEANQKTVVRDYLRASGYTDEQISKKIERYEDADMLYDEATDAHERLKEMKTREIEEQQRQQEEYRVAQEKQTRDFYESVTGTVNSLTNIRGIQIPQQDRKSLLDYIFKTNADGKTQYEIDYAQDPSKNLIESAYFTMKGNTLLSEATKNGESSATKKLKSMLRHSSKNHTTYNVNEEKQSQIWDIASKYHG